MMNRKTFIVLACLLVVLSGCKKSEQNSFQGYVEGEYVYLSSPLAGRLQSLLTARGSQIGEKALLFELESDNERYELDRAEKDVTSAKETLEDMKTGKRSEEIAVVMAQLEQARVAAANAEIQFRRYEKLVSSGSVSKSQLDDFQTTAKTTAARVAELSSQLDVYHLPERERKIEAQRASIQAMEAYVDQARWNLAQKRGVAPVSGLVYDTLFRVGEWVPAGSPVVQMLPPGNIKIRFFVPEAVVASISVGSKVTVTMDGRPDPVDAVVSYVANNAEYTPPVIYSNETRAKLVFMIEAKPNPKVAGYLHPGQPVSVKFQ